MDKTTAKQIWNVIRESGKYSFNKSHACAYAVNAYWGAYLKTYYPKEFYVALLNYTSDNEKVISAIRELRSIGISVNTPDVNYSKARTNIGEDGNVYMGLEDIDKVGPKAVAEILKKRPFTDFDDFVERVTKRTVNSRVKKNLVLAGAFDNFGERETLFYTLDEKLYEEDTKLGITNWDEREIVKRQASVLDLPNEKALIDYYENPLDDYIYITPIINIDFTKRYDELWIKGVISDLAFVDRTDSELDDLLGIKQYATFKIDDGTKMVFCNLPTEILCSYKDKLKDGQPYILKGHCSGYKEAMYIDGVVNIEDYDEEDILIDYIKTGREDVIRELEDVAVEGNINIIKYLSYKVSKNGNPYARIILDSGEMILNFEEDDKPLKPGEVIHWEFTSPPKPFTAILNRR